MHVFVGERRVLPKGTALLGRVPVEGARGVHFVRRVGVRVLVPEAEVEHEEERRGRHVLGPRAVPSPRKAHKLRYFAKKLRNLASFLTELKKFF